MAYYGVPSRIRFWAWDTSNNIGVAGDAANLTLTLTRDGSDSAFAGTVTDLGGGLYSALVSATLMQATEVSIRGTSSTADVTIFPIETIRTVRLPNVQEGTEGGVALTTANGVLTAGQQGQLDGIEGGVDALGTGQSVAIDPVGTGGKVTIYKGFDYTTGTQAITIPDSSPSVLPADGTALTLHCVEDKYGDDGVEFDLTGEVLGGAAVIQATQAEVGAVGVYRYMLYSTVEGEDGLLIAGQLVVRRGK